MSRRKSLLFAALLLTSSAVSADKVIMKDGKIYEGRIMGETDRSLLISNEPLDPKPRFVELKDILTIVRESHPPETVSVESDRFASLFVALTGNVFTASTFSLSPAPGLQAGGAFRLHPLVEIGTDFHWIPEASGAVHVTDGTTLRGYEHFYTYAGGFSVKLFPFFRQRSWRAEPYLTTGFRWNRLVAKASGDYFTGKSLRGGAGVEIPWYKPVYWNFAVVFEHAWFDRVKFLSGEGDVSDVKNDSVILSTGLSYHFL